MQTDCVKYLQKRANLATHARSFNLIVADPPYNYGQKYADYNDRVARDKFEMWTYEWLAAASINLDPHGSMWVFVPDEWVSRTDLHCQELGLTRRNWIVWSFTFGQKAQRSFTRSHCHILYFTKDSKKFTFNLDAVAVPSARTLMYKDKRAAGLKPPDDTWMLLGSQLAPYMTPDRDTWLMSRICGTFKERQNHSPNQLPIPLVERIVLACSNPGDYVLDPFLGSGTTGVVCKKYGRSFLGLDVSKECVVRSKVRIEETKSE